MQSTKRVANEKLNIVHYTVFIAAPDVSRGFDVVLLLMNICCL